MGGAMAPNIDAAQAMTPLLMVLMILFGGFYINAGSMPVWIAWLENLSIIKCVLRRIVLTSIRDWSFVTRSLDARVVRRCLSCLILISMWFGRQWRYCWDCLVDFIFWLIRV